MKKLLISFLAVVGIAGLAGLSLLSLHLFEFNQLVRADAHINFVKLIEKENVQDKVMSVLYSSLMADYCSLKADQELLVFKYTIGEHFTAKIDEIESLFATTLKAHHERSGSDC
jgi:hypothetical protein